MCGAKDDQDFTKRLFTPIPLDGIVYLSKTTWPITTVFRLWLENINWVSNAETASGPTPKTPPVYAEFLSGMDALERMQDRRIAAFFTEERDEKISEGLPTTRVAGNEVLEAAKAGYEFRKDEKKDTWTLTKKKQQAILRIEAKHVNDADVVEFCRVFKLKPGETKYEIVADKADPFLADCAEGGAGVPRSRNAFAVAGAVLHERRSPPRDAGKCGRSRNRCRPRADGPTPLGGP